MIILNPEFHRNLWLKFSPFKLIAMPIVVAGYIFLFTAGNHDVTPEMYFMPAASLGFAVLFLFGNYEAANALSSEIKNNTWDFQKMSAIGPWQLAIGKLFGATSYVWYYAIPLIMIMAYSYLDYFNGSTQRDLYVFVIALVLSGIFGHAAALLISLQGLKVERMRAVIPLFVGIIVSYFSFSTIVGYGWMEGGMASAHKTVEWHGIEIAKSSFDLYSLLFFLFWVFIAIQRLIREELQYQNAPLVWMAFVASTAFYFAGQYDGSYLFRKVSTSGMQYVVAFFVCAALLYMKVIEAARDLSAYKRWLNAIEQKDWFSAYVDMPRWVATLCLALPLMIFASASVAQSDFDDKRFSFLYLMLGVLLFTLRDGLFMHGILLGKKSRHARFKVLFYYFLVYFLLIAMTYEFISIESGRDFFDSMTKDSGAIQFFLPTGVDGFSKSCLPVVVQCGLAGWFLKYRLDKLNKE